MPLDIKYDNKSVKQLQKLDKKVAHNILDSIEKYSNNTTSVKVKKLKTPFKGAYRLRVGDYRVIFYQKDNLMLISKVAHRKDSYL